MIIGMFLGMVMVLGILGVIVVVRMYSNIKKLKGLVRTQQEIINNIYLRIDEVDQMINRRIDGEIDRTNKLNEEANRYTTSRIEDTSRNLDEVYRQMDSRFDKLTNKLSPVKKDLLQD
jgi:predicted Holliday junction resolvase-like endonuclease